MTVQPVFLVGAQRSGTTALGLAVARAMHAAGGRFTVNGKLLYLLRRWCQQNDVDAGHFRADEIAYGLRRRPPLGPADDWMGRADTALDDAARRVADSPGGLDADDVARRVCRMAYGQGAWGDKYNEYLLDLPYLDRLYPKARWVFLYRHPAEVAQSLTGWAGKRPWNPTDTASCLRKWAEWNGRWLRFRSHVPAYRRVELEYGDLCEGRVGRLGDLLGCEPGSLLQGYGRKSPAVGGAAPPEAAEVWEALRAMAD